jgi:glycosyltransferase involved in cell wall biosynthesis
MASIKSGNRTTKISLIMPIYNGEGTIARTLGSLHKQRADFDELIIIDDASIDRSMDIIKNVLPKMNIKYRVVQHKRNKGLASSYNEGVRLAKGSLVITVHQDIILKRGAIRQLALPLIRDKNVVAAYHSVIHPLSIWLKYPFWQKCLFSRLVGKEFSGLDGKFDCFRKNALLKVGLFDSQAFRRAGEDGDIVWKLKRLGKVVPSKAIVIHLHKISENFSLGDYIYKHAQYANAQGALFRRGRIFGIKNTIKAFFRELFLLLIILILFLPFHSAKIWIVLFLVLAYSFLYTKNVYFYESRNPKILSLPFVNILLLFVSLIYSTKGFIYGKQEI